MSVNNYREVLDFYKQTSMFTNYGKYQAELIDLWINQAGQNLGKLSPLVQSVAVHRMIVQQVLDGKDMTAYGDFSYIDFKTPMSEDDILLTAPAMLAEIFRRDERGFYIGRSTESRINVTCRYVAVLVCAILKANGIPCRARAGWAHYFDASAKGTDHWVNEYWNGERWVMFDMDDLFNSGYSLYQKNGIAEHFADFDTKRHDLFTTGAEMWLKYRENPDVLAGMQYGGVQAQPITLVEYLFFDLFSLMNYEVSYTFTPVAYSGRIYDFWNFSHEKLASLDELARLLVEPDRNFGLIRQAYENTPEYRMVSSPLVGGSSFDKLQKRLAAARRDR